MSGWIVTDNDDTHVSPVAANTSIGGGGFLALEVDPTFGLGASDSARLFTSYGTTLVALTSGSSGPRHNAAAPFGRPLQVLLPRRQGRAQLVSFQPVR